MNSLDADTRLPPRKRLLAGLRKECSIPEVYLPASNVFDRIRELVNSRTSSPDEIIEASRSAALAAAEVAAAARATMMEKAIAAAKAKAVAKHALELLASISRNEDCEENRRIETGSRKKHVCVKLLYKRNQHAGRCKNDEELAHRLHRSMNCSTRILSNGHRKRERGVDSPVFSDKRSKLKDNTVLDFKAVYSQEKDQKSEIKRISMGKEHKFQRKKFRLIRSY